MSGYSGSQATDFSGGGESSGPVVVTGVATLDQYGAWTTLFTTTLTAKGVFVQVQLTTAGAAQQIFLKFGRGLGGLETILVPPFTMVGTAAVISFFIPMAIVSGTRLSAAIAPHTAGSTPVGLVTISTVL